VPTFGFAVFAARLAVAVILVLAAALTDRYWLVVIAVAVASPVINPPSELSLLAAIPRLLQGAPSRDRARAEPP
jgi:hypothetical protein